MLRRGRESRDLAELASALGLSCVRGEGLRVSGVSGLESAGPEELAALYDARRWRDAEPSRAGALIVPEGVEERLEGRACIPAKAPKAAFARATEILHPKLLPHPGIAASAFVDPDAEVHRGASVGSHASIGPGCRIAANVVIGAGAVLLDDVEVGEGSEIHPRVVIYPRTIVGRRCRILAGAVIGAPGFGHAVDEEGRAVRVPHLGRVLLEDEVEIGANATVDRASFGETRLRARARIDNLVQVAHNVDIGEDVMMAAQSGLSGSSRLGRGVVVGGQSGLADHVSVGDGAAIAAKTAVFSDVPPRTVVAGTPAMPISRWRRLAAIQARLPDYWKKLRSLLEEGKDA